MPLQQFLRISERERSERYDLSRPDATIIDNSSGLLGAHHFWSRPENLVRGVNDATRISIGSSNSAKAEKRPDRPAGGG
jgi:hypothetical protein